MKLRKQVTVPVFEGEKTRGKEKPGGVDWSIRGGRLTLAAPGPGRLLSFRGLSGSVTVDGENHFPGDAPIRPVESGAGAAANRVRAADFLLAGGRLAWRWEFRESDGRLYLDTRLKNLGEKEVTVSDWHVLHGHAEQAGLVDLGGKPEQVRFFSWRRWRMQVERFAGPRGRHDSSTLCHLYAPDGGITCLLGFVSLDRMETAHAVEYVAGRGITGYRATCLFGEYRLGPGKTLAAETLRVSFHDDPCAALEDWAGEVHARYRPSFEGAAGVCLGGGEGSAWAEKLLDRAGAAREQLKGFGIDLVSGGTHDLLRHGLPGNWLTFEEAGAAQDGAEKVLARLREKGFGFKFWFSPFWFFAEAEGTLEENRGNLLRDAGGDPITRRFECGGWEFARGPFAGRPLTMYYLDGTHPATKAYLGRVVRAYRQLNARAWMLDFLAVVPGAKRYDETLLPLEAGREILKVIRAEAGPGTHLQTAVGSSPGFIGCVHSARVVRDYGEGRPLHPFPNWRNATHCLHDRHFSDAHSFVQNAAASWFTHRRIYLNDLNNLKVDQPLPLEHARISCTMFGLSGDSPMIISDNLRTIAPERLRMLKTCLPRTAGVPVPVDLFENVAPDDWCHVLKKEASPGWDDYLLVAVFNTSPDNHAPGTAPYLAHLDFANLGLDGAGKYRVFEFWNEAYLGTYRGSFECLVPPDACRLFRISRARPYPWLLSTDMHVEQGNAEIAELSWDRENLALRGTARRPAGERGTIFCLMPRHLKLVDQGRASTMKEVIDMQTVIRQPIFFERDAEDFELRFEVMDTPYVARRGWLPYATETEWLEHVAARRRPGDARVIE